ncbi:MAG TPA: hypothetical protein VF299_01245 [Mycobacterium sp.]
MTADSVVVGARTDTVRVCPRCGAEFEMPARRVGRRPVWCSPRCRRAASAERIAAARAGAAVRVVEVPRSHRPDADARLPIPSMAILQRLFLSSDYQCRILLETLQRRYAEGRLDDELAEVMQRFALEVCRTQALAADVDYIQARTDITRTRAHLQADVERAQQRDRELGRLRHEAAQIPLLRARIAELQANHHPDHTNRPLEPAEPGGHTGRGGPGLSRQQRRAATRAATKNH